MYVCSHQGSSPAESGSLCVGMAYTTSLQRPDGASQKHHFGLPGILAPDLVTRKKKQTRARHRPPRARRASKKASSHCHTSHNGLSPGQRNPEGHHTKDPSPKFSGEGQRGGTLKWFPRLPLPLLACGLAHQKSKQSRK